MHNFDFYWPVKFIFGAGETKKIGIEAKKLGRKAFLVTGRYSIKKSGVLDKVVNYLKEEKIQVVIFDEIESNPRSTTVDKGGKLAKKEKCDLVIGMGGGSAMDSAKGISLMAKSKDGVSIWDYMWFLKNPRPINIEPLPGLMIPTLPATGSEGNSTAVITNLKSHQKVHLMHPKLFPKVSIIDPELTMSLSPAQLSYAGVDIICHLLEPYLTNVGESFVKDRIAEGIIITVLENLPKALKNPEDLESRSNLCWAGTLACSPLRFMAWNGKGYLHWIEHCLSAWTDVPHSEGLSSILISWLNYMSKFKFFKFRLDLLGERVFNSKDTISKLQKWLKSIRIKTRPDKLNDDLIEKMAKTIMEVYSGGKDYIDLPSGEKMVKDDFAKIYKNSMGT
ncbi:MAG: iron-containing alcohol dehydrogenase [Candidatus Firestonebacteria bacterium]